MSEVHFATFRGPGALNAARADWERVTRTLREPRFYHRFEWYASYLDAVESKPSGFAVTVGYADDVPVLIAPLAHTAERIRTIPVRVLSLPRHPHLPLSDLIVSPAAANPSVASALLEYLRGLTDTRWDLLRLGNVPADAAVAGMFGPAHGPLRFRHIHDGCDVLPTVEPFERLAERISSANRATLRRRRNKLAREHEVEFGFARDPLALDAAFDDFLQVEASGWKGAAGAGSAIALHPELVRFYRGLIARFGPTGECEIATLRVDGTCAAAQFYLVVHGTYYSLKVGYDETRPTFGATAVLLDEVLRRACADPGITSVNLVSHSDWQQRWGPNTIPVDNYWVARGTPQGAAAIVLLRAARATGAVVRLVSASFRRGLVAVADLITPTASVPTTDRNP